LGTADVSGTADTPGTSGTSGTSDVSGPADTSATKKAPEQRDHVKVARSLAAEMRDAVWFLSEHGRPRVQLGELLDEAVRAWLNVAKAKHNGGEPFPARGRLR